MSEYLSKIKLDGKVAVVVGGLGLIGKEISMAFAEAGAKTIIADIDKSETEKFIKTCPKQGNVHYEDFDVSKLDKIEKKLKSIEEKYGSFDVFVNCAYPRTKDWGDKVEDLILDSWRKNVDMHLNSYSWISRKVCLMMKEKGGCLINFGSIYGLLGNDFTVYEGTEMTSPMAYSAIKAGIINITRYLASYFGKNNVRVNNICPGGVFDGQNETFVKNYSKKTPLGRLATTEEIAGATLFLASPLASYITGATLVVDGGYSII